MSTFPPHATAFIAWACSDLAKATEILDRHPRLIRSTNSLGETALHYRVLLAADADPEAVDQNKESPLHLACRKEGVPEIVEQLLQAGADVNAFSGLARPLDVPLEAGREDLAALLRAAGGVETSRK